MTWIIILALLLIWAAYNIAMGRPFVKKKIIYRGGTHGDGKAYLVRYSLRWFSCKWWAVKVHNILLSDDACLHDHPWHFLSIILWGGYLEHRTIERPSAAYDDNGGCEV